MRVSLFQRSKLYSALRFQVSMDGFDSSDLGIGIDPNDNTVKVSAEHAGDDFKMERSFPLPEGSDLDAISSAIQQKEGKKTLVITAPRK